MTRDAVIAVLRANEAALRLKGVAHAALFGSLSRGEAGPDSDTPRLFNRSIRALRLRG